MGGKFREISTTVGNSLCLVERTKVGKLREIQILLRMMAS
jgi:predicted phosphatase